MKKICDRYVFCLCKHVGVSTGKGGKETQNMSLGWSENSSGMQLLVQWDRRWTKTACVVRLAIIHPQTWFWASRFLSHFSVNRTRSLQLNTSQIMEFASWSEFCNSSLPVVIQSDRKANKPRATPSHWLWSRNSYYPAISITKHPVC